MQRTKHYAALDYRRISTFMAALRGVTERRYTWLNSDSGAAEGVWATDDQMHVGGSHASWPLGDRLCPGCLPPATDGELYGPGGKKLGVPEAKPSTELAARTGVGLTTRYRAGLFRTLEEAAQGGEVVDLRGLPESLAPLPRRARIQSGPVSGWPSRSWCSR